jgi:ABC-type enterochelin transport system ATPase subunit
MNLLRIAVVLAMMLATDAFAQDPAKTIVHLMAEANKTGVFNDDVLVGYRGKVIYTGSFGSPTLPDPLA